MSPTRLPRRTCWAHHKPCLQGLGQRDGTLIADAVPAEVQLCQGLVLLVMFLAIVTHTLWQADRSAHEFWSDRTVKIYINH